MTTKAFIIGHPVAHSRSPLIHRHWLEQFGLDGSYERIDIEPGHVGQFFDQLRTGEFLGGNVTIPHKLDALRLADELSDEAKTIGAVNTLVVRTGKIFGHNTDMIGFLANLDANAPGWDKNGRLAIVLGAGGASRAIIEGVKRRGFDNIAILNRTIATAKELAAEFGPSVSAAGFEAFENLAPGADILVNCTSIGMKGSRFDNLPLELLPKSALVTDIVYTPLITPLLADAEKLGLKTVDGLGMLLHQAVPGFQAWFGKRPEVTDELRDVILKDLGQKQCSGWD